MSQSNKKGSSWGILARLTVTLALGTVFGLGISGCLPLHIGRGVLSPVAERDSVVYNVPPALACSPSSSGTWVIPTELMLRSVCPLNMATRVPSTRLTPFGSEARQAQ